MHTFTSRSDARQFLKAVNRYFRKRSINTSFDRKMGLATQWDPHTFRALYPSIASVYSDAAGVVVGRPVSNACPPF